MATRFEIISQTVVRSIALENHFDALREGFHKPIVACLPLVTAHSCACLLIRTCCSLMKCGLLQERGTTTLVLRLLTLFVLLVASSPTSSAADGLPRLREQERQDYARCIEIWVWSTDVRGSTCRLRRVPHPCMRCILDCHIPNLCIGFATLPRESSHVRVACDE